MSNKEGDTLSQRREFYSFSWLLVDPACTGGEALFLADDADPGITQPKDGKRKRCTEVSERQQGWLENIRITAEERVSWLSLLNVSLSWDQPLLRGVQDTQISRSHRWSIPDDASAAHANRANSFLAGAFTALQTSLRQPNQRPRICNMITRLPNRIPGGSGLSIIKNGSVVVPIRQFSATKQIKAKNRLYTPWVPRFSN
jgi:hypothetical protein